MNSLQLMKSWVLRKQQIRISNKEEEESSSFSDEVAQTELNLESILIEVSENKLDLGPLDAFLKNHSASIYMRFLRNIEFLREFLNNPGYQLFEDDLLKQVESMFRKAVSIISEYDLKNLNPIAASQLTTRLLELFEQSSGFVSNLHVVYRSKPKRSRDYYPKTAQLVFVESLVKKLEQLLNHKPDSIGLVMPNILKLQKKLQEMSFMLMEIPQLLKEDEDFKALIQSFTSLAYEVEYAIDLSLVGEAPIWYTKFWLDDILEELDIKERKIEIASGNIESILMNITKDYSLEPYITPILHRSHELDNISSNGSEISDKVREFFCHPTLQSHYFIRTWCLVSSYKGREKKVFRQLLDNAERGEYRSSHAVNQNVFFRRDMSEDGLKLEVYRLLHFKSYVVILEDVRDFDAIIDIVNALPRYRGSRVLVITSSTDVATKCRNFHKRDMLDETAGNQTLQINKPIIDNDVVGFVTETERMLERLIEGPNQLCIISIVGMAGQGKSTLAMKLYNDTLVTNYFDMRMWSYISQVYEKRGLLLELLGQVIPFSKTILDKNDEELAEMLYKRLKGMRFLVFLDDMWTTDVWSDLRRCFPNDNNGSRIMFTTRIQELASQTNSMNIVQQLFPLSHEESWELLKKKVFQKESCPQELLIVGKEIAKNCNGLPLSVVLVAGFLEKMEKSVGQWKDISSTLSTRIMSDAGAEGRNIIEMSYKHLPDHLRPCFLYFGAFLEDREVPASKLIRLWLAEGFIKCTDMKTLEDVAKDYLMALIGRSLVTVAQEKSNGGVKLCRVHDLLHGFCFTKAKEENFLQQINGYDEHFPSFKFHLRRLCIHSGRDHLVKLDASGTFVRSLLFFATSDMGSSYSYDASFIFRNFKLVTILDLEDIKIGDSFEEINFLVLLRYLSVQCHLDSIPSSIANLWNLETFIFKGLNNKVVNVPCSIWDMTNLRHVHISECPSFDLEPNKPEMSFMLDNLQTFSTPSLAFGDDMEKTLRSLPNVRKLNCIFLESWDDVGNCNQLPQLENLEQMESLRVCYSGEVKYPYKFNLPSNLKELRLSNFHMPWNEISQFATLGHLEVLKLEDNAFDGEIWEMEDEVFSNLKFLKLENLNLVEWNADADNFPHLEHLVLHKCKHLEEIPPNIGENTLQSIKVMWCNPSVAASAKNIQEEQMEFSNDSFRIYVHPKVWDSESSS